jgi:phospholipid/cholesterol/gamma-HCH transport system substrate-binding protein
MSLFTKGGGRTSVLERNQMIIGIVGILFVVLGSAFSLLLSGGYFSRTYAVTTQFADAAGLKSGDQVKVAGLEAGSVDSVAIKDGVVEVALSVSRDVELPADSTAEITIETLLGKKTVTFFAGSSNELLADGDLVPIERTRTPVELLDIGNRSVELLEASDAEALQEFMEGVTRITEGKRAEIIDLVEGFGDAAAALDDRGEELARLIDSLRTLSATFAQRDDTLVSFIDNFDVVLGNLAQRTDDLRSLLDNTDLASHEVADLVRRNRPVFDSAIAGLTTTLRTVDRHQVDLAATVSYLEQAVRGYSSVGYSQGIPNRWANIFVQSLGPIGMDAYFGPCGAVDQALDQLLGPDPRDCPDRARYGEDKDEEKPGPRNSSGTPQLDPEGEDGGTGPVPGGIPSLPGDVGDLLDSVTGSFGLGETLRGTL